ncbi:MAG: GlmU family protein [Chryseotalea sp. WA131a]|nr:MAG: GlmU family protein [Chryseotalea sp. WA131a]
MNLILFDHPTIRQNLLPFTFTRPVATIRTGILTIAEKWEKRLNLTPSFSTESYLTKKFPLRHENDNLWINGALCPDADLVDAVLKLNNGDALTKNNMILAVRTPDDEVPEVIAGKVNEYQREIILIDQMWKIFQHNGNQLGADFQLITKGRKSEAILDKHTRTYNEQNIFIEPGVKIWSAILNAENGPIYLGKNSQVQEGAMIRGPFALGEGSVVNMGGKMRGDVSIGPGCKVGGEVSASVFFANSNKAHDGFLGCSVIGEWCNFGADSNTSNLKNNYENVKLWSYAKNGFTDTGLVFCGLMMADHSKCGINTMFNTGTVTGVSSNIFGDGFPRNIIPSYSWGGAAGFTTYQFEKAIHTAQKAMERRGIPLTELDKEIYKIVFESTAKERVWEKISNS